MSELYDPNDNNNNSVSPTYDMEISIDNEITDVTTENWQWSKVDDNEDENNMDNKRFYCVQCKFLFSRKSLLDNHMQIHAQYNCLECEYTTCDEEDLKKHTQSHTNVAIDNFAKLNCSKCSFSTRRPSALASHLCKPFTCKLCGKEYTNESHLESHLFGSHGNVKDIDKKSKTFACTVCGYKCRSYATLQEHKGRHYLFNFDAEFNGESGLKSLMETHTVNTTKTLTSEVKSSPVEPGTKKFRSSFKDVYTCKTCGYYFMCHQHLKWHLSIHDKNTYYNCSECEYKTVKPDNLKMHREQHHFNK